MADGLHFLTVDRGGSDNMMVKRIIPTHELCLRDAIVSCIR